VFVTAFSFGIYVLARAAGTALGRSRPAREAR
jgi:hypothetical protein